MRISMPSTLRISLLFSIIIMLAALLSYTPVKASDNVSSDQTLDTPADEVQNELIEQGLIEEPEADMEKDEETKDEETKEEDLESAEEAPVEKSSMMAKAGVEPPDINPEESIFTTSSYVVVPDISMKLGAAMLNYPIQVPPGRNGLAPNISLNYNSSVKNGIAGVGWQLNTGSIKRSTKNGIDYTGTEFTYNGEDLVPAAVDADGYGTYRPEKEADFSDIEYLSDGSWQIILKNGTTLSFGYTANSRQATSNGTFEWFLETITDTNNNVITYTYLNDSNEMVVPSTIEYINYYTISFLYETRPDVISGYKSKSLINTSRRLKTITVESADQNIRAYGLTYGNSANTGRSLLQEITQYGSDYVLEADDTVTGTSLPPTRIAYNQDLTPFSQSPGAISSDLTKGQGFADTFEYPVITGDWNGDGRRDIARAGSNAFEFYVSTGTGFESYASLSDLTKGQSYNNTYDHPLFTGDFNGDGKTDIGRANGSNIQFYVSNGTGFDSFTTLSGLTKGQGFDNTYEYPTVTGDFNGDGMTDIGRISGSFVKTYLADGTGFEAGPEISGDFGKNNGYPNSDEYPVFTGDFDGDGRTDIGRVHTNNVKTYLARDAGFVAGPEISSDFAKNTGYPNFKEYPLITGDFNGDGLTDIARAGTDHVKTYLCTINGFVPGPRISSDLAKNTGCPTYKEYPIFTGDFNDDGLSDIGRVKSDSIVIYIAKDGGFEQYGSGIINLSPAQGFADNSQYPLLTGDFKGTGPTGICRMGASDVIFYSPDGNASDLAYQITASSGSISGIAYTPSSQYQNTRLPFVLKTVSQIITGDGLGNTSATTYSYSNGLYDFKERELRSFEYAVKTNPDGSTEITRFHQDKYLDGRIASVRQRSDTGTILAGTGYTWTAVPIDDSSAFIRLDDMTRTFYENGESVSSTEAYTYFNTHGSLETKTVSGSGLSENITTRYEYGYYGSGSTYPLCTTRETLEGSVSGITRQTDYDYYSDTGNLYTIESVNLSGDNPVTTYAYDEYGNVTGITDPKGFFASVTYDDTINTHVKTISKPQTSGVSHVTTVNATDYRFGKPTQITNENNASTNYHYDAFGRIKTIDFPDSGLETHIYNDAAVPRSVIVQKKGIGTEIIETLTYMDGFDRTVQTAEKSSSANQYMTILYTFDNMGRQACVKGPFFTTGNGFLFSEFAGLSADPAITNSDTRTTWTRNLYDIRGRIDYLMQSGDIHTDYSYTNLSTTITDPDGNSKTQKTDILGRVIQVTEHGPSDQITYYAYNIAGDLLTVTRTNPDTFTDIVNSITYNTLGQKIAMSDPDMGDWSYTYDLNGNLKTQTDARSITLTFEYDELNRQTKKIYPDQSYALYEYDAAINGIGFLYRKSNANASTTYAEYDALGRVLTKERTIDGTTAIFDYTYDDAGRPYSKTITKDNNPFATLNYEFYGGTTLLKAVTNEDFIPYATITAYSPQGKIKEIQNSNSTDTIYDYNSATGRIACIYSFKVGIPAEILVSKSYEYTKAGDVHIIDNQRTDVVYTYAYDHLHRLISELSSGAGAQTGTEVEIIEFTYADEDGQPVHAPSQVEIDGVTIEYDYTATGNRLNKRNTITGTDNYESNDDNMISKILVNGVETNLYYDADSRRVKKSQNAKTTLYFNEGFEVINGTSSLYIFAGNLRIAKLTGTDLCFFHKDHLNSTEAISRQDGTVVDTGEYLPYGQDRNTNALLQTSSYKFTDQEQDDGTGLYNYDARLYDPVIGQFIMADSIIPAPFNPQSLNRYAYCLNSPLNYTDPTGHLSEEKWLNQARKPGKSFYINQLINIIRYALAERYRDMEKAAQEAARKKGRLNRYAINALNRWDKKHGYYDVVVKPVPERPDGTVVVKPMPDPPTVEKSQPTSDSDQHARSQYNTELSWEQNNSLNTTINGKVFDENGNYQPIVTITTKYAPHPQDQSNNNEGGSSSGGGSIICTELYRQGLMHPVIYKADSMFGNMLKKDDPNVIIGYHFLCRPIVKLMKNSQTVTYFINIFAKPWSYEMAYRMGFKEEGSKVGSLIMIIGIPVCRFLGSITSLTLHYRNILTVGLAYFVLIMSIFFVVRRKNILKLYQKILRKMKIDHFLFSDYF